MKRVVEGSRPILVGKFFDVDNVSVIPASLSYKVTRSDTGETLVPVTTITPAQKIEVVLPIEATTLQSYDEYPVRIVVTVTAGFSDGSVKVSEIVFITSPGQ